MTLKALADRSPSLDNLMRPTEVPKLTIHPNSNVSGYEIQLGCCDPGCQMTISCRRRESRSRYPQHPIEPALTNYAGNFRQKGPSRQRCASVCHPSWLSQQQTTQPLQQQHQENLHPDTQSFLPRSRCCNHDCSAKKAHRRSVSFGRVRVHAEDNEWPDNLQAFVPSRIDELRVGDTVKYLPNNLVTNGDLMETKLGTVAECDPRVPLLSICETLEAGLTNCPEQVEIDRVIMCYRQHQADRVVRVSQTGPIRAEEDHPCYHLSGNRPNQHEDTETVRYYCGTPVRLRRVARSPMRTENCSSVILPVSRRQSTSRASVLSWSRDL